MINPLYIDIMPIFFFSNLAHTNIFIKQDQLEHSFSVLYCRALFIAFLCHSASSPVYIIIFLEEKEFVKLIRVEIPFFSNAGGNIII
jgi:hypothetical protein